MVNALSTWLEVRVYQDGKIYQQRYERGKVMYPLKVVDVYKRQAMQRMKKQKPALRF